MNRQGIIEHYKKYMPVTDKTPIITLLEGDTPLIPLRYIPKKYGIDAHIWVKFEGLNPTGSFKDRGMTMAISKAVEDGAQATMCASTGNTSASAAAYSARAGIQSIVLIPEGKIALGKLVQALSHGAKVIAVDGNFDEALEIVKTITDNYPITLVNSINQYRIEGQKSGAFEICDTLGNAPDFHCIPVGNAGNITAYWKGYQEYYTDKKISQLPYMLGFQAAGSAPIVRGEVVKNPETIATAIRIGNPARWEEAAAAAKDSNGLIDMVTDDEIIEAYSLLGSKEGIFVEPASAASIAGLIKYADKQYFPKGANIVCVCTGHGLKDPDTAIQNAPEPLQAPNDIDAIIKLIGI